MIVQPPAVFASLGDLFHEFVPTYKGRGWRPFVASFKWDRRVAEFMRSVSERRCQRRISTYLIPTEMKRTRGSLRFGNVEKTGHGLRKERGDFCLVGGCFEKGELTVFYRRVELIGGLHYDLAVFREVEEYLGPIRRVTIMAREAKVFALRGNSNEKLYEKLARYYSQA